MRHNTTAKAGAAIAAGLVTAAVAAAAPAQADLVDDTFLSALNGAGLNLGSADALALGQTVCPMLSQPAGSFASAASSITGAGSMSPEMAAMFTEIAVAVYCPQVLSSVGGGQLAGLPQIPGLAGLIPGL